MRPSRGEALVSSTLKSTTVAELIFHTNNADAKWKTKCLRLIQRECEGTTKRNVGAMQNSKKPYFKQALMYRGFYAFLITLGRRNSNQMED